MGDRQKVIRVTGVKGGQVKRAEKNRLGGSRI